MGDLGGGVPGFRDSTSDVAWLEFLSKYEDRLGGQVDPYDGRGPGRRGSYDYGRRYDSYSPDFRDPLRADERYYRRPVNPYYRQRSTDYPPLDLSRFPPATPPHDLGGAVSRFFNSRTVLPWSILSFALINFCVVFFFLIYYCKRRQRLLELKRECGIARRTLKDGAARSGAGSRQSLLGARSFKEKKCDDSVTTTNMITTTTGTGTASAVSNLPSSEKIFVSAEDMAVTRFATAGSAPALKEEEPCCSKRTSTPSDSPSRSISIRLPTPTSDELAKRAPSPPPTENSITSQRPGDNSSSRHVTPSPEKTEVPVPMPRCQRTGYYTPQDHHLGMSDGRFHTLNPMHTANDAILVSASTSKYGTRTTPRRKSFKSRPAPLPPTVAKSPVNAVPAALNS